jgi:hypothetical protein
VLARRRSSGLAILLSAALWASLAGCHTSGSGAASTPLPDGGFPEVQRPTVVMDFDAPASDGTSDSPRVGAIPAVGGSNDASVPPPPPRWDAGPDVGGGAGAYVCSVLAQDCPQAGRRQGCYIGPDGVPVCQLAGDFTENSVCEEQQQCAPGLICVEVNGGGVGGTCQRACDPRLPGACGVGSCRPLAWITLGYCAP